MTDYELPPNQPWPLADEDPTTYVSAAFLASMSLSLVDLAAADGRVPVLEQAFANLPAPIPGPAGPTGPAGGGLVPDRVAAAGGVAGHQVVTPTSATAVGYADAATSAHRRAPLWMTLTAAAAGAPVDVLGRGLVTEPSWAWSPGPLYLGAAGQLTQTAPSTPGALFVAVLGWALSATSVLFDPAPSITLA